MRSTKSIASGRGALAGLVVAGLLGAVVVVAINSPGTSEAKPRFQVLVFSKTAGFRHDSIEAGVGAIRSLAKTGGFSVTAIENGAAFTKKRLSRYEAVVFLNTSGDVLDPKQQSAFQGYIRRGGGFVGIHSAADTEYDWPFYGDLLGAYFKQHPAIQPAAIGVAERSHPSTKRLPAPWTRTDEWYDFRANPRGSVHVLAVLDESTYTGGTMGPDHPIAWCRPYRGGRSWYTAGGHTIEAYAEPAFRKHLLGGILWAAGQVKGNCR